MEKAAEDNIPVIERDSTQTQNTTGQHQDNPPCIILSNDLANTNMAITQESHDHFKAFLESFPRDRNHIGSEPFNISTNMRTTASRVDFVNLEVIRDRRAKAAFKESLTRDFNIERNEEDEHSEDFDTKTKAAVPDNFFSDIPAINTGDLEAADEEIFREAVQEAGEAGAPENTNKHSNTSVWMSSIFGNWMGGSMKDTSETTSYKGHDKDGEGADSIHRHEDDEGNHEEEDDWVLT